MIVLKIVVFHIWENGSVIQKLLVKKKSILKVTMINEDRILHT